MMEVLALIAASPDIRTPSPVVQSGQFICSISDAEGNVSEITVRFGNHTPERIIEGMGVVPEQMKVSVEGWGNDSFPHNWRASRTQRGPGTLLIDARLDAKDWGDGHFRISPRSDSDGFAKGSISVWRSSRHLGFIGHCSGTLSWEPVDLTQ